MDNSKNDIELWKSQIETLSKNSRSERIIKRRFPDLDYFLKTQYPDSLTYKERIYWFLNNIQNHPICPVCHKPVSFRNGEYGYNKYCSAKCVAGTPETRQKAADTCIRKYGDAHYNNKDKAKATCIEKYGVDNPFAADEIKEKIKKTYNERYGVDYPSQSSEIQETRRQNTLAKYGVDHHMYIHEVVEKSEQTKLQRYGDAHYNNPEKIANTCLQRYGVDNFSKSSERKAQLKNTFISKHRGDGVIDIIQRDNQPSLYRIQCNHPYCNECSEKYFDIPVNIWWDRRHSGCELCTRLLPIQKSNASGTTLELFVRLILDRYNIQYTCNNRNILNGKEIDIYIPSHNLAIECNGTYWHSSLHKDRRCHMDKFTACCEKGIQLLTIWEDQIINHPEIVESVLLSKLGIYNERLYGRKCVVKEITSRECCNFLSKNHIQGKTNSQVKLGLLYNDVLVGVMTFSHRSKLSGGATDTTSWELTRFCTKLNTQIIGAASKLLTYFIKHYSPTTIVSFSSNDISTGSLYKSLGFKCDDNCTLSYWYISKKDYTRYHRTSFSKSKLKKLGFDTEGMTEEEIVSKNLDMFKIYDSGHQKWTLNIKK